MDGRGHTMGFRGVLVALLATLLVASSASAAPATAAPAGAHPVAVDPTAAEAPAAAAAAATGRFVPLTPRRVLDTRVGTGAPQGQPEAGASLTVQLTGVGGVPRTGVTAVTLNLTVTEPRTTGYVQVMPAGSERQGASSNLNIFRLQQTASNLVTVPVGDGGRITLHDVVGGHLIADVLGYFASAVASAEGRFQPLTPTRVVDTRDPSGLPPLPVPPGPLAAGQTMQVPLLGRAGIPRTGASAVALTVTATRSRAAGFVQVVPGRGGTAPGTTSNLNVNGPDETAANLVLVPLGADGTIALYSSSGTDVVVDVVGWFTDGTARLASAGLFVPVEPDRLTDTRETEVVSARSQTVVGARGRAGVPPDGVSALFLNVTATGTTGAGYLQVMPTGRAAFGAASSLTYGGADQAVATAAVTTIGDSGLFSVYTPTETHVVVDVFGYFTGAPPSGPGDAVLGGLVVAAQAPQVAYDAATWNHWTDDDGDCVSTRDEVLVAESLTRAVMDRSGCRVVSGTWIDPYTGYRWLSAGQVEVDHTVPLENAHASGGWEWDTGTKRRFANHLGSAGHLAVVAREVDAAKGAAGPEAWQPRLAHWCAYAADWSATKKDWGLTVTPAEHAALVRMVATCDGPPEGHDDTPHDDTPHHDTAHDDPPGDDSSTR